MDKKGVNILNARGDVMGTISIPDCKEFTKQYSKYAQGLKKATIPLQCITISPNGCTANKSGKKILARAEASVYTLFDDILGYKGAYKVFFDKVRPFARVGGKFYCDQCLTAIKNHIENKKG